MNNFRLSGNPKQLLSLWPEMCRLNILPNKYQVGMILNACRQTEDIIIAKQLFEKIKTGHIHANVIECTMLIQTFTSKSKLKDVMDVISYMDDNGIQLNEITYICHFEIIYKP